MTSENTRVSWSDDLRASTLHLLRAPEPLPGGKLHMKHPSEGFGHFLLIDLLTDRYELHRHPSLSPIMFDSPEAIVAAGWAID
ncbi:hypothetical protein OS187_07515 [Xanthomonadaceae bacterium JHOS43]|nr:hypothetical protein [Xanthomonadaceae bacterium JHOS43]MCX7562845.1 hypothetical protein [Xanthomonadaceae bacterium XH05]